MRNHLRPFNSLLDDSELQLMADFVDYLRNGAERRHREDTIRTYTSQLAPFFREVGGARPGSVAALVTKANLTRAVMRIEHRRESARRNLVFAVKAFARFLADIEAIPAGTAEAIAAMRFKSRHMPARPHLTQAEADALLQHILRTNHYDERERLTALALVSTLAYTGLRNSEVCGLRIEDVDFTTGVIQVIEGKGGKARTVGLPDRIVPVLALYLEHRPAAASSHFFVGPRGTPLTRDLLVKRLARLSKSAGIKVGAHMLRRTFATTIAHRGVPLDKLQLVMGHADIQTTRKYVQTQVDPVVQEMRRW